MVRRSSPACSTAVIFWRPSPKCRLGISSTFNRSERRSRGPGGGFDEARATYRATVLSALLDADNGLSRYGHQRDNVAGLADASASASRAAQLASIRLKGGTLSLIDALDIERQRINTQSSLAQAQALLTTDWIGLQSSLDLGWKVRDPSRPSPRQAR